jgi:hypothetical protein
MTTNQNGTNPPRPGGLILALLLSIFCGVLGFSFGKIGAFLYKLLAKRLRGLEIRLQPVE